MQAIVIATTPGSPWLSPLLASFTTQYPVIILCDTAWELGKIRLMYEQTRFDEFFFLHDTTIVKDPAIFDLAFNHHGSYAMASGMKMYMGKYCRGILDQLPLPVPTSKQEAVQYEADFNWDYLRRDPDAVICPQPLEDTDIFERRHGRLNMVLENDWLIKYKGTWSLAQIAT